ncbi:hypothetical protein Trisim1_011610 [Trichoderma cf. simile WF8]
MAQGWVPMDFCGLFVQIEKTQKTPEDKRRQKSKKKKTYNSRCSLVVTHPTTNLPVSGLSMGEQTGPRVLHYLWSYVLEHLQPKLITDI